MAIENPSSCPHCGGENGFHTKEVVDFERFYAWDGSFLEGQHTSGIRGGKSILLLRLRSEYNIAHQ